MILVLVWILVVGFGVLKLKLVVGFRVSRFGVFFFVVRGMFSLV